MILPGSGTLKVVTVSQHAIAVGYTSGAGTARWSECDIAPSYNPNFAVLWK